MAKGTSTSRKRGSGKAAAGAAGGDGAAAGRGGGRAKVGRRGGADRGAGLGNRSVAGKQLVIVESPSKAKTINKYLGDGYVVLASVGHVRDLPSKNPKGDKSPVPGVDLKHKFRPTYEVLPGKTKAISDLKRAARQASDVWFATDLDREGEAIAWHLAEELGIDPKQAKRVIFAAITRDDISEAFKKPHPIDMDRVNAQQARRILDRIVGYQVSPMLWKKVARGLSAGRVQSVAVRVIVEREREIRAFIPEESWQITANFTSETAKAAGLADAWRKMLAQRDEKDNAPTLKAQNAWLAEHGGIKAELVEIAGEKFELTGGKNADEKSAEAMAKRAAEIAEAAGLRNVRSQSRVDEKGKGPARWVRTISGDADPTTPYKVTGVETKRTSTRPSPPFITSTLQQAASTRLGFGAQRTMRTAQQLYEGVDLPGEGPVGLITYMRTDSTHLSGTALSMVREHILKTYGEKYLPEKPNFFSSSNKAAQEAHEAIRPTSLAHPPSRVRNALNPDQFRLYSIIWERFVACQMSAAQWDSTAVTIKGGRDKARELAFRATGRVLVFDGFYRVAGVPTASDEQTLPSLEQGRTLSPFAIEPRQRFTSPPARYSEASLIKTLESEGIGRPSTYASIISVIQDRKYVEQVDRRFYATDLGEVVTDKLVEAFPRIIDIGYTRDMEGELDKVEEDHIDWVEMLQRFYGPFKEQLEHAMETLSHAKAETRPAPKEYRCAKCGSDLVYRFGKNGRFLSCSTFPACDYACPVDREGKPRPAEGVNVACPKCGGAMNKRSGRFGVFLGCARYNDEKDPCDGILNLDKKGRVKAPSPPALVTDLECKTCGSPLNLRSGLRGPWLGCSRYPKCKGRGKWTEVDEKKRAALEAALEEHAKEHPVKVITTLDGKPLTDAMGRPLPDAPPIEQLVTGGEVRSSGDGGGADEEMEAVA
ncbi:MAG: type I DNA topoisomerase [Phycisphaeraceae bacterium]|nr:type I DNA topoisomerase [Phycisphaeraceae bacterium]